jgi:hypothetical protein
LWIALGPAWLRSAFGQSMSANRLLSYLACTLLVYFVAMWYAAGIRNKRYADQLRNNEGQVAAHIAVIRPQWEAFKRTNVGLEVVQIKPTYRDDGALEVTGAVTSQVQVLQVLRFLVDTHPPWPLYTKRFKVDSAWYRDSLSEPTADSSR